MNDLDNQPFDPHQFANDTSLNERISGATFPIYVSANGSGLTLDRSSVLIGIEDDYFLITAMHHFAFSQGSNCRFYVPHPELDGMPVDISGNNLVGFPLPIDVAVIRLQRHQSVLMNARRYCLTLKDLDLTHEWDQNTPFAICGYPAVYNAPDLSGHVPFLKPRPFTLFTTGYDGPIEDAKFTSDNHVAIVWNNEFEVTSVSANKVVDESRLVSSPRPTGMSGGGIWRLGMNRGSDEVNEDLKLGFRLSAIQSRAHTGMDYAVGGRAYWAIYALWKSNHALAAAIERQLPGLFPVTSRDIDANEGEL